MAAIESGRLCLKIAGREAGCYCVVVGASAQGFALITGPKAITGIKRRRCNIVHLEPTQHKLEIAEAASDSDIEAAWRASGLIEKLGIKIPVKRTRPKAKP